MMVGGEYVNNYVKVLYLIALKKKKKSLRKPVL